MIRWLRYNAVGIGGVAVQLSVLWLLANIFRVPYLTATALAVEIALLHNFIWHESWTWRGLARRDRWRRLLRFHLGNGFVSIAGNTIFTAWFRELFRLPLLAANIAAIAAISLLNFALAAWWVFDSGADSSR